MRNLSVTGFRIEGAEDLLVGEQVHLQVGKEAPVLAVVKWTRGSEAGGLFLTEPFRGTHNH